MSAFGDAFKAARAAGKKTFTFNGKSYHTRTKEDEAKAKPKPEAKPKPKPDAAKPVTKSEFMDLLDRNNPASKYMKKMPDNRSAEARGAGTAIAMEKMPNNRPVAEGAKFDDTSLSVNQRIKNDIKDNLKGARSSNTGTDKRSVTKRIKDSLGMMGGGKVKGYMGGGDIKGYGKARGAKACKMR
jgi:hypothetical protein